MKNKFDISHISEVFFLLAKKYLIMENIINECLPHIGEHIFGLLNGPELCVSRLVCKSWNDFLIHRNKLWSNISDEILNGIKNTTSQQWRIIKSHKKDEDESRKICLMLLWYRQKCKQDGTKVTVSPFVTSFNYPSSLKYLLSLSQVKNPIGNVQHFYLFHDSFALEFELRII